MKLVAPRHGLQVELAFEFAIERELAEVDVGVEDRRLGSARGFEFEIGAAFEGDPAGMELADPPEIEIISVNIEMEDAGSGVEGSVSSDDGVVVEQMHVVESQFAVSEMEYGIESLDGFAVSGDIVEVESSTAVRVGLSASGFEKEIGGAGNRIVVAGEGLERGERGVVQIEAKPEDALAGKVAMFERGGRVEFGGGIATLQSRAVKRDGLE